MSDYEPNQSILRIGQNLAKIVEKLYVDLTPRLIDAAKGCVQAHIELLEEETRSSTPTNNHFAFDVVAT